MALDDSYSVALLHFDGADASTTITDESGKSWTVSADAQIDTAQSKFGGASLLLDGTLDWITSADHADWRLDGGSNSNAWTIDFWVRFNGDPGTARMGLVQQWATDDNYWSFTLVNNTLEIKIRESASNTVLLTNAWNPAADTWYHVACVKNGTTGYLMFIDGTQIGSTQTDISPMPDFAGSIFVGIYNDSTGNYYLNGWMDELRISKGVARWTANFSVPTAEYRPAVGGIPIFFD